MSNDYDEWRMAVEDLTETDRYINENAHRNAQGIIGDKEDDTDRS